MSVARPPSRKPTVIERVMAWEQAYLAVADRFVRDLRDQGLGDQPALMQAALFSAGGIATELIKGTEEAG